MEQKELLILIEKCRAGDPDAQEKLVVETQNRVYYHCKKFLKNEEDALDATQDVLIAMITGLDKLREPAAFWGWLNGITANRCKHLLTQGTKEWQIPEDEEGNSMLDSIETLDDQTVPDKVIDNAETQRLIMDIIDNLPAEQRMTVTFFYYDEMSVKDIAAAMDVSEGTVKSRLNYARKAIKLEVEKLEKKDGTKLYSVSILPFLAYFLRKSAQSQALSPAAASAITQGVLAGATPAGVAAGSGATATGAGASTAAAPATATGAKAAATAVATKTGLGLGTKLIAGVLAGALALGGIGGGIYVATHHNVSSGPLAQAPASPAKHFIIEDGVLVEYIGPGGRVVIPEGVEIIDSMAFINAKDTLTELVIPVGVTQIKEATRQEREDDQPGTYRIVGAFANCSQLAQVIIKDPGTEIGSRAFYNCDSLVNVTLPDGLPKLGDEIFMSCDNLTGIDLPDNLTEIGSSTFGYCKGLTSITIPNNVTTIGKGAFAGCSALSQVTLPDNLAGDISFSGCASLTDITLPPNLYIVDFYECPNLTSVIVTGSDTHVNASGCDNLTIYGDWPGSIGFDGHGNRYVRLDLKDIAGTPCAPIYAAKIEELLDELGDEARFDLCFIDEDDTPELVVGTPRYFYGENYGTILRIYTITAENEVRLVTESESGIRDSTSYYPRCNVLYSDSMSGGGVWASCSHINEAYELERFYSGEGQWDGKNTTWKGGNNPPVPEGVKRYFLRPEAEGGAILALLR